VKKYNAYLEETILTHNIVWHVEAVYQGDVTNLNWKQLEELEDINKVVTVHKIDAEKQCQKIHAGQVPWTPMLTQAIYRILYWKGIKKRQAGQKMSREVLRKRAKQGSKNFSMDHLQLTHPVIIQKIKTAMQEYTQIKKQSN